MRKIMMTLAAIVFAFAAGSVSANGALARNNAVEPFWKCPSGYAFVTNGSAVHCKKAAYIDKQPLGKCTLGLYAYVDRIGDKDMCSATNVVTGEVGVERGCSSSSLLLGYTKRIVNGTDYCGKAMPAEIKPPSVAVSLTV